MSQESYVENGPAVDETTGPFSHIAECRLSPIGVRIPNKAAREKFTFDNKVQEVRKRLTPLAVTEVQKDLLTINMVAFQQVYIV